MIIKNEKILTVIEGFRRDKFYVKRFVCVNLVNFGGVLTRQVLLCFNFMSEGFEVQEGIVVYLKLRGQRVEELNFEFGRLVLKVELLFTMFIRIGSI